MTNLDRIKTFDAESMALTMMCPYDAGLMASFKCNEEGFAIVTGNCKKCKLEWLKEEEGKYFVGDRVIFMLLGRKTIGVITKLDGYDVWIDAGAGELWMSADDIIEVIV